MEERFCDICGVEIKPIANIAKPILCIVGFNEEYEVCEECCMAIRTFINLRKQMATYDKKINPKGAI